MIYYGARPTALATIQAYRAAGFGAVLTAGGQENPLAGMAYGIDNGAWPAYTSGREWDGDRFLSLLIAHGPSADWVAVPDIVCGGVASLRKSEAWVETVLRHTRGHALIPVQDGMKCTDVVRAIRRARTGLFIGGSSAWKESTLADWVHMARGRYVHVGRVNTLRRITMCLSAGVDSADGSGTAKYPSTVPDVRRWMLGPAQTSIFRPTFNACIARAGMSL